MCSLGCCHSMLASFLCLLNLVSLAVGGILTGTGLIILIISFFGCCGTCTETSWMVRIYSVLLIIALLFEIGIVTASLILNEEIIESLGTTLTQELVDYNVTSNGMKFYDDSN